MNLVQSINSAPLQQQTIVLDDGTTFALSVQFVPEQYAWFIPSLIYGDFVLNGIKIVNSPNFLFQWMNLIPFGMACYSTDNREPSLQDDFSSGASKIYILNHDECDAFKDYIRMGTMPS